MCFNEFAFLQRGNGNHLAQIPQINSAENGGLPVLRALVGLVGGLAAAVKAGDVHGPALFLLEDTDAAANGAVLQIYLLCYICESPHEFCLNFRGKH